MKRSFRILILCLLSIVISCREKPIKEVEKAMEETTRYPDGKIKERKIKATGDSVDFYCERFFPIGTPEMKFSIKNGLKHGIYKEYYENGKLSYEGVLIEGRKKGYFKYYDVNGKITKIINFINYRDSAVAMPNEIIRIGENGDTLFSKSYFYLFYRDKDTIKANIEKYRFMIVPRGSMFKYFYIAIGGFDEKFRQINPERTHMTEIKNGKIELSAMEQNPGYNFIRGYILCTESPLHSDGTWDRRAVKMFFSQKYYIAR